MRLFIQFHVVKHEKNTICCNYDNTHITCCQANSRCVSPCSETAGSCFCLQREDCKHNFLQHFCGFCKYTGFYWKKNHLQLQPQVQFSSHVAQSLPPSAMQRNKQLSWGKLLERLCLTFYPYSQPQLSSPLVLIPHVLLTQCIRMLGMTPLWSQSGPSPEWASAHVRPGFLFETAWQDHEC